MAPLYWLRTNELTDAVEALEMMLDLAKKVSLGGPNIQLWKWVLISLHNALQGFMVCSLMTSNPVNVLIPKHAKQWLKAFNSGSKPPKKLHLRDFLDLLGSVHDSAVMQKMGRKELLPSAKGQSSLEGLHDLRNQFMHFLPKSWSIEVSGLPDLALDCVAVVDFLALTSGNIVWTDCSLRQRCESATKELATCLKKLENCYYP